MNTTCACLTSSASALANSTHPAPKDTPRPPPPLLCSWRWPRTPETRNKHRTCSYHIFCVRVGGVYFPCLPGALPATTSSSYSVPFPQRQPGHQGRKMSAVRVSADAEDMRRAPCVLDSRHPASALVRSPLDLVGDPHNHFLQGDGRGQRQTNRARCPPWSASGESPSGSNHSSKAQKYLLSS
jgi:hypothetical protein